MRRLSDGHVDSTGHVTFTFVRWEQDEYSIYQIHTAKYSQNATDGMEWNASSVHGRVPKNYSKWEESHIFCNGPRFHRPGDQFVVVVAEEEEFFLFSPVEEVNSPVQGTSAPTVRPSVRPFIRSKAIRIYMISPPASIRR